jgi:hypothetical protein
VWWGFVVSTMALRVIALCAYEATKSARVKPNWEKRLWHIHGSQWTSKRSRSSIVGSGTQNTCAYQHPHSPVSCYSATAQVINGVSSNVRALLCY